MSIQSINCDLFNQGPASVPRPAVADGISVRKGFNVRAEKGHPGIVGVYFNGRLLFRIRQSAGGLSAQKRAEAIVERLNTLNLSAEEIRVEPRDGGMALVLGEGPESLIVTVTGNDGPNPLALAHIWAEKIQAILKAQVPEVASRAAGADSQPDTSPDRAVPSSERFVAHGVYYSQTQENPAKYVVGNKATPEVLWTGRTQETDASRLADNFNRVAGQTKGNPDRDLSIRYLLTENCYTIECDDVKLGQASTLGEARKAAAAAREALKLTGDIQEDTISRIAEKIKRLADFAGDACETLTTEFARLAEVLTPRKLDLLLNMVDYAVRLYGMEYAMGGTGLNGKIDCSGFTERVYKHVGIVLPRTADDQFTVGGSVSRDELRIGDLVFFETYLPGASHVGIYLGGGKMIHASASRGVVIDTIDVFRKSQYVGARRILG